MAVVDAGQRCQMGHRFLKAGAGRQRSGGENDAVSAEGEDLVGVEIAVAANIDAELVELTAVPGEQVGDLGAARLQAGQAELAAKLRPRFEPA